jgi:CubicO group peptidase (beta-lactamase class C family)
MSVGSDRLAKVGRNPGQMFRRIGGNSDVEQREAGLADREWRRATAEAAGCDPTLERKLRAGIESGLLRGLHTVAVCRGGALILEYYGEGRDESIGRAFGHVSFLPDRLHDLRSVTKSIVGLLYGMALDRGLVPPPEAPLVESFPEYADLRADPARRRVTIGHALTMTMGFEWDESKPYTGPENSEIAMEMAPDRYRFALDRPIVAQPGSKWIYSGGAVALIGALIERGSGQKIADFARHVLFTPLGIADFEWWAGDDGVYSAAAGLRLTTRDLLRIGTMLLDGGRFDGNQVVPAAWIEASFEGRVTVPDGSSYGYLWYLGEASMPAFPGKKQWVGGMGNGGQRLWLMPEAGLACVVYAGDYNGPDSWVSPTRLWREIVLASVIKA